MRWYLKICSMRPSSADACSALKIPPELRMSARASLLGANRVTSCCEARKSVVFVNWPRSSTRVLRDSWPERAVARSWADVRAMAEAAARKLRARMLTNRLVPDESNAVTRDAKIPVVVCR